MTCDHCKAPIQPGEPYSVTEYGRLHSACFPPERSPRTSRQHVDRISATVARSRSPRLDRKRDLPVLFGIGFIVGVLAGWFVAGLVMNDWRRW